MITYYQALWQARGMEIARLTRRVFNQRVRIRELQANQLAITAASTRLREDCDGVLRQAKGIEIQNERLIKSNQQLRIENGILKSRNIELEAFHHLQADGSGNV